MSADMLFNHAQKARAGEVHQLTPFVRRIIAPNAGPYTFTGTCTYLIGRDDIVLIDPGPNDEAHISALIAAVQGQTLRHICVTHTHRDHSPAAMRLKELTGAMIIGCAPILTLHPTLTAANIPNHDHDYRPDFIMQDGQRLIGKGYTLTAIATPGHARNHLCFAFAEEQSLFSGDHVMGWSTSIVAPPDGNMRAYLDSLHRLEKRVETVFWPGHGDAILDPQRKIRALIQHRHERERAICTYLARGCHDISELAAHIYQGLDPKLVRGASLSILAHMEDLMARDIVVCSDQVPHLSSHYQLAPSQRASS